MEVWDEDKMDRLGYKIEVKGLYRGLKVNDGEEFPDLGVNIGLPNIDSPSYKRKMKEIELEEDKDVQIDLVQEIATEDNMQKLMDDEYNEGPKKAENKLGFNEFQNI